MPNHFFTIGLCARDWKRLRDEKGEDYDYDDIDLSPINGANFANLVNPLPDELKGIIAASERYRYRHKTTGEFWTIDANGPPIDEKEEWERVILTEEETEKLQEKYGAVDWYGWQINNWGTKWGTYSTKVTTISSDGNPLLIQFESAWGPPSPEMMRKIEDYICKTYYLKNIRWLGHDPYDGNVIDIEIQESNLTTHNQSV